MMVNGKFIGLEPNLITPYTSGDDEITFLENREKQSSDWYYQNIKIEYSYNKNGHRCENIEDIDLDNYILFTGCSHTEGVGLELEKTYPYLVSKRLGMDYYNLAVGGSGLDVLEYNLLVWLSVVSKKPKAVVIQWPDHSRFVSLRPGYDYFIEEGSWSDDKDTQKFIAASEVSGFLSARKKIINDLLYQIINVPIYAVQYSHQALMNTKEYATLFKRDLARDLSHSGIESHQDVANTLIEQIYLG